MHQLKVTALDLTSTRGVQSPPDRVPGCPPHSLVIYRSGQMSLKYFQANIGGSEVKNPPVNAGDLGGIPGLGRSPETGSGNTPVFLPGKSHGQRSLVGYSPQDGKRVGHDLVTKQPNSIGCSDFL